MRKIIVYTLLIFSIVLTFSCKSEDDDSKVSTPAATTDNSASIVNSAFIDIPSAISSDASASTSALTDHATMSTAPNQEQQPIWDVYEGIRSQIADIEKNIPGLKTLTVQIYSIIGTSPSGSWTDPTPTANEPTTVAWGPASNGYAHKIELFYTGNQKGFQGYLTVDKTTQKAKGVYTWDFSVAKDSDNPSNTAVMQFKFDSTTNPKLLEIKASNITNSDGLRNLWIKVTAYDNHVVNLWGNLYFQGLDMNPDSTADATTDRNYVYAVTGYDETGLDTLRKNKVILSLALPDSSVSSTTNMWNDFSVSKIYISMIKDIWTNMGLTVAALESWVEPGTDNFGSVSLIADLTDSQVVQILNWASANSTDPEANGIKNLIFVTQLVNPAYFYSNGFYGTCKDSTSDGICDQGTQTGNPVPSGFGGLDINAVTNDVVPPATVKNLTVGFF